MSVGIVSTGDRFSTYGETTSRIEYAPMPRYEIKAEQRLDIPSSLHIVQYFWMSGYTKLIPDPAEILRKTLQVKFLDPEAERTTKELVLSGKLSLQRLKIALRKAGNILEVSSPVIARFSDPEIEGWNSIVCIFYAKDLESYGELQDRWDEIIEIFDRSLEPEEKKHVYVWLELEEERPL